MFSSLIFKQKLKQGSQFLTGFLLLFLTSCTSLFFQPDRILYSNPSKYNFKPEVIYFDSKDQTKLLGWYFKPKEKKIKGTIIQFHGNSQNISSQSLSLLWLIKHGYALFTFDYRGYGGSEGEPNIDDVIEDGIAGIKQGLLLHKKNSPKSPLILIGQSLGGALVMKSAELFGFEKINPSLIVLDSTFYSYQQVASGNLQQKWWTWIIHPFSYILVSDKYETSESLKKYKGKLLVIHDEEDPIVPFENGNELFYLSKSKEKEFWELKNTPHIGVFSIKKNRTLFLDYLKRLNHK
ncbi:MAG: hypothetical protein CL678_12360 [Bdellovibrionaceae bacterium]|nr:hypothetical protein [Pseudobdellovibrionaceae bacterium]